MANAKDDRPITYLTLNAIYNKLKVLTYEERIVKLGLNPDRSDVIIPATELFLKTLQWSGAKVIYVQQWLHQHHFRFDQHPLEVLQ